MGLLDDVLSSVTGQRSAPSASPASGNGMASMLMPILMAIMANKAGAGGAGGLGGGQGGLGGMLSGNAGGAQGADQSGGLGGLLGSLLGAGSSLGASASMPGGSLGGTLSGMLGGGGLAGALGQLVSSFQQSGHGGAVESWVGNGSNASIGPQEVNDALGPDTLDQLSEHTGMPQSDIASQLSQWLPQIVNKLTPNGRLPTPDEASKWN